MQARITTKNLKKMGLKPNAIGYNGTVIFKDCTIRSIDVEGRDFVRFMFDNVNFENCNFCSTNFVYCTFKNVTFYNCNMHNTDFIAYSNPLQYAYCGITTFIGKITFKKSNVWNINLSHILMNKCVFEQCTGIVSRFHIIDEPVYAYKYTDKYLIVLELPKGTIVYKSTNGKCRSNQVKTVSILNLDGSYSGKTMCRSWKYTAFIYRTGQIAKPRSVFNIRYKDCASGIHFFMSVKEAYSFYRSTIV